VHFQRHFATRALTPTDVNLLQQSEGGRGGTLTINSCAEAFIRIRAEARMCQEQSKNQRFSLITFNSSH
jgi:hypothetical protein